jgi:putative transport protein
MKEIESFLLGSDMARLTLIAALGYLVGNVRLPGDFRLGTAAVMFVGLGFGIWNPDFALPLQLQTLGLMVFVYGLGLEAGPAFFQSLKKGGLVANLCIAGCLTVAALLVWLALRFGASTVEFLAGTYCGALNSTPALGSATETVLSRSGSQEMANRVAVGYGVAYPFAILALLFFCQVRLRRHVLPGAAASSAGAGLPPASTIWIGTEPPEGGTWVAGDVMERTGLVLSTIFFGDGKKAIITRWTELPQGARIIAIGSPEQLAAGATLLGGFSPEPLHSQVEGFQLRRYMLSNRELAGTTVGHIQRQLEALGGVVTR